MANKPKFLKNLLTTTSALAAIVAFSNSAAANERLTVGNATITGGVNMGGAFINGDVIKYGANGHTMTTGGAKTVGAINVNGLVIVNAIDIADATTIGSIADVTVGVGKVDIDVNFAGALTLNGTASAVANNIIAQNTYTALRNITLNNAAAVVTINPNGGAGNTITLTGTINAKGGAGNGIINTGAGNVVFNGMIGNTSGVQKLAIANNSQVTLGANAKFDDTVGAGGIVLATATSKLTVGAGVNITTNDTNNGALSIDGTGNNGLLVFQGASTVGIAVGTGSKLTSVEINNGIVDFQGSANNGGGNIKSALFNLNNAGAVMKLSTRAHVVEGNILNTTGVDAKGTLQIDGNFAHTLKGDIGAAGATGRLAAINFTAAGGASKLALVSTGGAAVFRVGSVTTDSAGNGILSFGVNAAQSIDGVIGAPGAGKLGSVVIHSDDGVGGALTTVTLVGNADATKASKIYATTVDLAGAARQNVLELGENTLIDAAVDTSNGNNGALSIKGTTTVTGKIGNAAVIKAITFDAGSDGKVFTVGDGTATTNIIRTNGAIAFNGNNATLALTSLNGGTITPTGGITTTQASGGKITTAATAGNTLEIAGAVGANGNAIAAIEAKAGGTLKLSAGDAYVTAIDITGNNATVELANAGNYMFGLTHTANQGIVKIIANVAFKNGTVLSADNANAIDKILISGGDRTVTFEKATNIFAVNGLINDGANLGQLTFLDGTSIIGAEIGIANNQAFNTLTVNGANTIVELQKAASFNGNVILTGATATLKVGAALKAADIKGNAGNDGVVVFLPGATKYTGNIGAGNKVSAVQIEGGDLEITGTIASNAGIAFTKDVASTLNLSNVADVLNGQAVTSLSTTRGHSITLANTVDIDINQAIGSNANNLGYITLSTDKKVTISNKDFFAGIKTTAPDQTEIDLAVATDDGIVYGLGDATNALKSVTFSKSATVTGDTFSKNIKVLDLKTANFNGNVTSSAGLLLDGGNGSNAVFGDGNSSFAKITTANAGKSAVTFKGATRITQTIGEGNALDNITFASADAAKVEVLGANIAATTITHGKGTLLIGTTNAIPASNTADAFLAAGVEGANVTVDGIFTGTDSSFVLPTSTLTFKGVGSKLVTSANVVTQYDGTKGGNIVVDGANNTLDLTTNLTSNLNLTLIDTSETIPDANGRSFTVLGQTNGGVLTADINKISFTDPGNTYVKWASSVDGKNIKLTQTNNVRAGATADFTKLGATQRELDMLGVITDAGVSGDAFALQGLLKALKDQDPTGAKGIELVDRLDPLQTATTAISNDLQTAVDGISNRISSVAAPIALELTSNDNAITGVSAGEGDNARYGAWGNPFYSQSTQKFRKGIAGYKAKAFGATVGFDTMANDTMTVGAAVTAMKTDVKHKNAKTGDKTKADTFMFSIYGLQQVTDNWFVQGVASFGTSKIKNTEKRVIVGGYQTASAKYDSMNYGGEVLAGYNYKVNETMMLTPMFGINYNRFNDTGYKEAGTVNQYLFVSKKSFDKFEAVLGGRAAMSTEMNGVTVTPEVHAFVRHDLRGKGARLDARLTGALNAFPPKSTKPNRTMFNVGLGVNARNGMMQYGIGYDAHIANKYVGHLGSIKVRVNF